MIHRLQITFNFHVEKGINLGKKWSQIFTKQNLFIEQK